jgi:hypothetical protein
MTFEFLQEHRDPFLAAAAMADRIIHHDALGPRAIRIKDLQAVTDRTFLRIEVVDRELFVLRHLHLFSKRVDTRVQGDFLKCCVLGKIFDAVSAVGQSDAGFADGADSGRTGGLPTQTA